ncbi:MAG: exodeoxyribonuclease III [Chloroflexota bacterium]|nr:exodeoxyribonuclease III [Chloroflexota bacterium]
MRDDLFRVATFNANSIRVRLDQILAWMEKESADVVCVQETKVQDADFPRETVEEAGYQVVFRGQKGYSGVAVISREASQDVHYGFDGGGEEEQDEPRLIRVVVQGIPIVNTYVPQGRSADAPEFQYKLEWFDRLRDLFERNYSPDEPLLWVGDFNVAPEPIDIHDPDRLKNHVDFHPKARAALARVRAWGFVDLFRHHHPDEVQYTYWDYRTRNALERGLGWRVDHIWATEPLVEKSRDVWVDEEARRAERPSDHTFVVAEFELGV